MKYLKALAIGLVVMLTTILSPQPIFAVVAIPCGAGTCNLNFTCQPAAFCCPNLPKPTTACGTNCCTTINCFTYNNGITDVATCYPSSNINIEAVTKGATKVVCYKMVCSNGSGSFKPVVATDIDVTCADPGYTVTNGWDAATDSCRLAPIASDNLAVSPGVCGNFACEGSEVCENQANGSVMNCATGAPAVSGSTCNACLTIMPPGFGGQLGGHPSDYTVDTSILGIKYKSLGGITSFVVKTLVGVAGVAFMIMFLLGAFKFVTSQGDKAAVESAKGTMTGAFIGIALAAALFAIMTLLQNVFGVSLLNITI